MTIFNKLNTLRAASAHKAQTPMTEEQVAQVNSKLRAQNRVAVYPNKFNIDRPFSVACGKRGEKLRNFGTFTNVDVAAAVGTIVSLYTFGQSALKGNFDQSVAENHPEFLEWLKDDLNADVVQAVMGTPATDVF